MNTMKTDLTFQEVCKFVKRDNPDLEKDIDLLLNLLILMSPLLFLTPQTTVLAAIGVLSDLFGVKDGIVSVGARIFNKITSKSDEDSVDKLMRMRVAYVLICYTSFFDSLEQLLPVLLEDIKLSPGEKFTLSEKALIQLDAVVSPDTDSETDDLRIMPLALPHPAKSFNAQEDQLLPLYEELSNGFLKFLRSLAIWENMDSREQRIVMRKVRNLKNMAYERFQAQYYDLAERYNEFFVWANLHEHKKNRVLIAKMSKDMQHLLIKSSDINVGMGKLTELASTIPARAVTYQASQLIKELPSMYKNAVNEPAVDDPYDPGSDQIQLTYPKKSEIFIPQSFQVLRYSGKSLEDETTWELEESRNDLEIFLISYLSSPYSETSPLIVLGHPGSGKSLLTSMIASRLIESPFVPIRVILRDIQADNRVAIQIEEQLRINTNRGVGWGALRDELGDQQPLILFDGYDELLQASGKVFAGYVGGVQEFQENELSLGRCPARTIITSRITLIDKAIIPKGATVIRLRPFNGKQRAAWVKIWNRSNQQYFKQTGVKKFSIPRRKNLVSLAKQPLLLLMLALYDSERNQLRKNKNLEQTVLYDSLLRRFISRERKKSEKLDSEALKRTIDEDMERLAVAAIGMFNRRSLHIKISELDKDLNFFTPKPNFHATSGERLTQAELLLGSFFFVHESISQHKSADSSHRDTAFEFLHNTFGEFLTAEFILRKVVKECDDLTYLRKGRKNELYQKTLNDPDTFPVVCFAYAPLHSRPVIIGMMQEWLKNELDKYSLALGDFLQELDALVVQQFSQLLTSNKMSAILIGASEGNPFRKLPTLGHIALYTLNAVILLAALFPDGYQFDEDRVLPSEDGQRAWDRLTHLWRSWFSLENLSALTSLLETTRSGNVITIKLKSPNGKPSVSSHRLDVIHDVSIALSDNILAGLSGYFTDTFTQKTGTNQQQASALLKSEEINLGSEFLEKQIRLLQQHRDYEYAREMYYQIVRTQDPRRLTGEGLIGAIKLAYQFGDDEYARDLCHWAGRYPGRLPDFSLIEAIKLAQKLSNNKHAIDIYERARFGVTIGGRNSRERNLGSLPIGLLVERIKLAEEFGNARYVRQAYQHIIHDRDLYGLPVSTLFEVIKLTQRFGEVDYARKIYDMVINNRRRHKLPLDFLVETIRTAYQFDDTGYAREIYDRVIRIREPHEIPVDLLLDIIGIAYQFDDAGYVEEIYGGAIVNQHPSNFPDDLLSEAIKLAQQFGDIDYAGEIYKRAIQNRDPREIPEDFLLGATKLALQFDDINHAEQIYNRVRSQNFYDWSASALAELFKLAQRFDDDEIMEQIRKHLYDVGFRVD